MKATVLCLLLAVAAFGVADARVAKSRLAMDTAEQLGASAQIVARINEAGAAMHSELARSGVKGYICKSIYKTNAHEFPYSSEFLNSKYGDWIPTTQKSLSIFLQGEASAKAFVGISAGLGVGLDMTVEVSGSPKKATGEVQLFACAGLSLSIGFVGGSASAGGGVLVGFGKFKDSVVKSNVEIGAEVEALGAGGVGVLLDVVGGVKAFRDKWKTFSRAKLGPFAPTKEYAKKCWNWFRDISKAATISGFSAVKSTIVGFHVMGGVGVGGGGGASVDIDGEMIIAGIRKGFEALKKTKVGSWITDSKVWKKLGGKLTKISNKIGKPIGKFVGKANEFFDYVPLTEAEAKSPDF